MLEASENIIIYNNKMGLFFYLPTLSSSRDIILGRDNGRSIQNYSMLFYYTQENCLGDPYGRAEQSANAVYRARYLLHYRKIGSSYAYYKYPSNAQKTNIVYKSLLYATSGCKNSTSQTDAIKLDKVTVTWNYPFRNLKVELK